MGAFKQLGMSGQGRQRRCWALQGSVMKAPSCLLSQARRPAGLEEPVPAAHWCSLSGRGRMEELRSFEFRRHRVNLGFLIGKMKVIPVAISQDCEIIMESA